MQAPTASSKERAARLAPVVSDQGAFTELEKRATGGQRDFDVRLRWSRIARVVAGVACAAVVAALVHSFFFKSPPAAAGPTAIGLGGTDHDNRSNSTAQGYGYGYGYGSAAGGCHDWGSKRLVSHSEQIFSSCQQIKDRGLCGHVDAKEMCCETCGPCESKRCSKFDRNYGVAEDPWNHTHCTQSTTTNFEGRSASCAQLLKHRETHAAKCDDVRRPATKHCATYSQYWANISGGASKPFKTYPASANNRMTAIAIPNTTMPRGGWPWLLHFSFMLPNGEPCAGFDRASHAGISDQALNASSYDIWYGRHNHQRALKGFVEAGFAVVMVSEYMPDGNFYSEDKQFLDKTNATCNPSEKWNMCWNDGDNPDAGYYSALFDGLAAGKLVPNAAFNMRRMGIVGYSVGCHMTSRYMQSWPDMVTPAGMRWPTPRAGIMVAGGSLNCYNYPWSKNLTAIPGGFLPCERPTTVGCCPTNRTEPRYDDGVTPYGKHPPMLMLQTTEDEYSDQLASQKYYNAMNSHGAVAFVVRVKGKRHGWVATQVAPAINFMNAFV